MPRAKRRYWLFKSEPDEFSISDLRRSPRHTAIWDGVRNYQARNLLRDEVGAGDGVIFYHSSTRPPHVAGFAEVVRAGYPDPTAFDPRSRTYDPKSDRAAPRWYAVDIRHVRTLDNPLALERLRTVEALREMPLLRRGMRLSIQPVSAAQWRAIQRLAGADA